MWELSPLLHPTGTVGSLFHHLVISIVVSALTLGYLEICEFWNILTTLSFLLVLTELQNGKNSCNAQTCSGSSRYGSQKSLFSLNFGSKSLLNLVVQGYQCDVHVFHILFTSFPPWSISNKLCLGGKEKSAPS